MKSLSPELYWLTLTTLSVALMWVPHIVQLALQMGIVAAVWDPYRHSPETANHAAWAQRARRAHLNAVENLAVFAPLVLVLHLQEASTPVTAMAAAIFFFSRLVHFLAYALAIPMLRVVSFLAGVACCLVLGQVILVS